MGTTYRLTAATLITLLLFAADAAAQWVRPPRPRTTPQDSRPSVGLLFGPNSRVADSSTGGFELVLGGEIPVSEGHRGRAELGVATWATDPATERGATRLTVTHATLGIQKVSGAPDLHAFVGGGLGLYRFRVDGAGGSGTKTGVHGGFGMEAVGRRLAVSLELRLTFAGGRREGEHVNDPHDTVLHGSVLFGVKRVF